jgi:hypothetical protein
MLVGAVVDMIGGNSAWLIRVATDPKPQAAIDAVMNEAGAQIESCLHAHPEYTEALRQLVLKGYDEGEKGMLEKEFNNIVAAEGGSSSEPSDVISVAQQFRVLHKNLQNTHVVFHTYPHYQAAKQVLEC